MTRLCLSAGERRTDSGEAPSPAHSDAHSFFDDEYEARNSAAKQQSLRDRSELARLQQVGLMFACPERGGNKAVKLTK